MSLFAWLGFKSSSRQVSSWAVEVARRCHADVSVRLGQQLYRMSLPEARGYVRARAAQVIDNEMASVVRRTGCSATLAAAVRSRVVEEVIRLAIGDLLHVTRRSSTLRQAA